MDCMTVRQIFDWLNGIAPFETAEDFDNVGLLMGDMNAAVKTVLFGMDLTEDMAQEALRLGAGLIVTHHPFIFSPIKRIDYTMPQGRALLTLLGGGVSVLAAHTNWDKAPGGVSDSLANTLSLTDVTAADDFLRVGSLRSPSTPEALDNLIQGSLHAVSRRYGSAQGPISRVAVAGGAYGEGYSLAIEAGAQAFVVGEIKHHELVDACARGLTVYDAGHFATELPGMAALYERFLADAVRAKWPVKAHLYFKAPYAGALLAL